MEPKELTLNDKGIVPVYHNLDLISVVLAIVSIGGNNSWDLGTWAVRQSYSFVGQNSQVRSNCLEEKMKANSSILSKPLNVNSLQADFLVDLSPTVLALVVHTAFLCNEGLLLNLWSDYLTAHFLPCSEQEWWIRYKNETQVVLNQNFPLNK